MELTHMNDQGRARMVDVSDKPETTRTARARTSVELSSELKQLITDGDLAKGDVLAVAQVAGIMAAKETSRIIPMCHPLALKKVDLTFEWDETQLIIESFVKTKGDTGVEMEALTAASVAALTVYDMTKAVDKGIVIGPTYLLEKQGGKSGDYVR
ncbi:MAG: cyclic pyranopterin monophosphate synthase MoaC [Exiguobacterium sp.]|jgi:cyclic pyranopterin phosphate synthase|uniref:Cyclic pyranopterin monophosphate synthase n=1 Tax=Exiguobacterium sp. (strain ATCC BAA-1283 / AT1b) TaxID=360911 RepID=C4L0H9_EXISA|nr:MULTISPECIES: cyclic pyranopterin monophosphate synthase MoaC [Exiguobacterium]MDX5322798.1 cyclic pyranopterin monophosphate synthase MoaC [Exiguobacterium sp.]QPI67560.1 cyclic pyranopterin monophosphate synthase MoaC [Exiguobacterium sp. PBE]ACQ70842.1 molybdenum cofactor biosynthesis protein C [Exiguobacterium sp. AT1b]MCT4799226.1 cyclic pyranopterin monophosphate synthase MoaC [Exiguobacterium profundum]MCV9900753.1 cyclic pyranopterin monophosphate synthase MoaC [Exiguobacterium sp. 